MSAADDSRRDARRFWADGARTAGCRCDTNGRICDRPCYVRVGHTEEPCCPDCPPLPPTHEIGHTTTTDRGNW